MVSVVGYFKKFSLVVTACKREEKKRRFSQCRASKPAKNNSVHADPFKAVLLCHVIVCCKANAKKQKKNIKKRRKSLDLHDFLWHVVLASVDDVSALYVRLEVWPPH